MQTRHSVLTDKIYLRSLQPTDSSSLALVGDDPSIAPGLVLKPSLPYPYTERDALAFIYYAKGTAKKLQRQEIHYGMFRRDDEQLVGVIGLRNIDRETMTSSFGYWVGGEYRGQGFGTQAVEKIVELGFTKVKLREIGCHVFRDNYSSLRVLEKFGFRENLGFVNPFSQREYMAAQETFGKETTIYTLTCK